MLDVQSTFNVKTPKKLDFRTKKPNPIYWIFDIERELNIQHFWIFGFKFGWMLGHPL
jgi:hypothetical protein